MYFIFLDIRPSYHIRLDTNSVWPVNAYNKDKKNPFTTLLITFFLSLTLNFDGKKWITHNEMQLVE